MNYFHDIWTKVDELKASTLQQEKINNIKQCLVTEAPVNRTITDTITVNTRGNEPTVTQKIEKVILNILKSVNAKEAPYLEYSNRRKWENVSFHQRTGIQMLEDSSVTCIRFDSIQSVNKLALTLKLLSLIYKLIQTDRVCTKRDLYYQDPALFGSQSYLDGLIDNISCMLKVPRWHLNILATSKGYVAGDLQYTEHDGNYVDCRTTTGGILVPNYVEGMKNIYSSAKVILIIEKDATFQKLLDDNITTKLAPCILITGKGVPDLNTRLLVRKLWDTFHTPTFAVVDADPHGMEIMSVYKYGSLSMSFDAHNLTVPTIKWLGVLPSDIQRLQISKDVLLPLSKADQDKAHDLLKRPYIVQQPKWRQELELMLKMEAKAEIQCLSSISHTFLSEVYLPNKLKFGGWI